MARRRREKDERAEAECYYCGRAVPESAMRCPHCRKLYSTAKKLIALLVAVLLLGAGLGYIVIATQGGEHMPFLGSIFGGETPVETQSKIIVIELFTGEAPITARNFMSLAEQGRYNGVAFHRVIDNFMIQGGDFTNGDGTGGHAAEYHEGLGNPDDPNTWVIPDEFHPSLTHDRGMVSMANRGPDTGGSQFFIVQNPQGAHHLDNKHAVFGRVVSGMEIVDAIAKVPTDSNDRPLSPVIMKSVTISYEGGKTYASIEVEF
ncbi:MAG: peptidylprolyl isomerase [Candidatus Thermoplasmatota archaeon]